MINSYQDNTTFSSREIHSFFGISFNSFTETTKIVRLKLSMFALNNILTETITQINSQLKMLGLRDTNESIQASIQDILTRKESVTSVMHEVQADTQKRVNENEQVQNLDDIKIELLDIPTNGCFSIRIKNMPKYLKLTCVDGFIKPVSKDAREASIYELKDLNTSPSKKYLIIYNL